MKPQSPSPFQPRIQTTFPPHIFSKTPTTLSTMHIPNKTMKQQPKHIRDLKVSPPSAQEFWEVLSEFQSRTTDIKRLKKTTRIMQKTKALTKISISLSSIIPFDLGYGLSRFQYLQSLQIVNLNLSRGVDLTPSNIEILQHTLASLKSLKKLSIELPELPEVSFELIDSMCFPLRRLPFLAHLSMKFDSLWGFGDSHVKRLALHLKKLPQLKSLALNFYKSTEITNTGLQPLAETLKNLPLLSDFSIHLRNFQKCSASTFHDLFCALAIRKSLGKLDFFITPDPTCNLNSIEPLSLGLSLLNVSSLHEVTLKLYKDFNDYGMTQLSKALARFSSLKVLSIEFPQDPSISDKGLSHFSFALQTLKLLSSLSLISLRSCQASQARSLPNQTQGFAFSSSFPQSNELSKPIDLISQGIAPLKHLEYLHLDLLGCFGAKFTTTQALSSSLQNLKLLRKLNLNLCVCHFMEDEDIALLTQGLEALKDLTHIEIDIRNIKTLTNQTVITLMSVFSKLPKLDHLTLKLGTNKTDDNVPEIIAEGLKNIPALFSLHLDFACIDEASYNQGLGVLCDSLQSLVSLRKIALELNATNTGREIVKKLQKVKPLTITWR